MLNFLPSFLIFLIACTLLSLNILFWVPILVLLSCVKLILPFRRIRLWMDPVLVFIAESWISCNSGWMALTQRTHWDVEGIEGLNPKSWYMVSSNHQSWVDIAVLQHLLNQKIPLLKFFLKQELIWVPFMGMAWWALDFPFMQRHSKEYLRKHPEMRGKDQETTRAACAKFSLIPTSVMSFVEGTRITPAKHISHQSPYQHLLKPKAGGMALALNVMGEKFQSILDVTIVYPDGIPSFVDFLAGKMRRVVVRVHNRPIPAHLLQGDYEQDPAFRAAFAQWLQDVWREKDAQIVHLLQTANPAKPGKPL